MMTGASGGKSTSPSAVDRLRNVHVAIIADDTNLVCDCDANRYLPWHIYRSFVELHDDYFNAALPSSVGRNSGWEGLRSRRRGVWGVGGCPPPGLERGLCPLLRIFFASKSHVCDAL